jgi:hypothetical protein
MIVPEKKRNGNNDGLRDINHPLTQEKFSDQIAHTFPIQMRCCEIVRLELWRDGCARHSPHDQPREEEPC